MRQLKIIGLLFYLIYLASVGTLQGQNENYLLADYELSISGTSTLHDWECSVNEVDATVVFSYAHQRISGIESLRVTITSESILFRHKITPYIGHQLKGMVKKTFVSGVKVYDEGDFISLPTGQVLFR